MAEDGPAKPARLNVRVFYEVSAMHMELRGQGFGPNYFTTEGKIRPLQPRLRGRQRDRPLKMKCSCTFVE